MIFDLIDPSMYEYYRFMRRFILKFHDEVKTFLKGVNFEAMDLENMQIAGRAYSVHIHNHVVCGHRLALYAKILSVTAAYHTNCDIRNIHLRCF